jgi:hypothetical protein
MLGRKDYTHAADADRLSAVFFTGLKSKLR